MRMRKEGKGQSSVPADALHITSIRGKVGPVAGDLIIDNLSPFSVKDDRPSTCDDHELIETGHPPPIELCPNYNITRCTFTLHPSPPPPSLSTLSTKPASGLSSPSL